MALPAPNRRRVAPAWLAIASVALLVALAHMVAPAGPLALDKMARAGQAGGAASNPAQAVATLGTPGDSFTGSAYFFAEDAFVVAPPVTEDPFAGNAHILPLERGPAAGPVDSARLSAPDRIRALQCLTNAIYYEAGNEPEEGQRAVAQVVLNRVASPLWPNSVCGVVYQGGERSDMRCQFTFSCDGSMARVPVSDKWARAWRVAQRALDGDVFPPVGLATFYHTLAVRPGWSESVRPVAVVGAHIFYRLPGQGGAAAAFRQALSGIETARPGPYAYVRPARPLPPLPVGPAPEWLAVGAAPAWPGTQTQALATSPASMGPTPQPVYGTPSPATASSRLPTSRIRPEYLNSGRPLDRTGDR